MNDWLIFHFIMSYSLLLFWIPGNFGLDVMHSEFYCLGAEDFCILINISEPPPEKLTDLAENHWILSGGAFQICWVGLQQCSVKDKTLQGPMTMRFSSWTGGAGIVHVTPGMVTSDPVVALSPGLSSFLTCMSDRCSAKHSRWTV